MVRTKILGCQIMRVQNGFCIVKSWCKKVRDDDTVYGRTNVWYDVCGIADGELGDCYESFKSFGSAVKCLNEIGG